MFERFRTAVTEALSSHADDRSSKDASDPNERMRFIAKSICDHEITSAEWTRLWAEAATADDFLSDLEATYAAEGWKGLLPYCGYLGKIHQVRLCAAVALHHELLFRSLDLKLRLRRDLERNSDDKGAQSDAAKEFKREDEWRAQCGVH
mmetsp:Transcript_8097/g.27491  ORF Transcript_8097/g.27491 Transcript_8097/m.27491 type:complete len:149 (-) Transcript_8097:50-496(-)